MRNRMFLACAAAVLATCTAFAASACTVSQQPGGGSGQNDNADKPLMIGFSEVTLQSPFYVQLRDGAQAQARKIGAKLVFADANGDVDKQNNDVQDMLTRGVNVLLINPVDPKGVAPAMAAAKAANVPVITVDRPAPGGAIAHVGRDNRHMGQLVGQRLVKALGPAGGTVVEIQGDAGGDVARQRRAGFHAAVKANPKIHIVEGPYADYVRAQAVTAMQDLLQAHPDVKAVYAHNDDMALGALQVLRENGRTNVRVCGVDGLMDAVKDIANGGPYVATASNDPIHEAQLAVDTAQKVHAGKSVPKNVDAGTTLIDASNAKKLVGAQEFAPYQP